MILIATVGVGVTSCSRDEPLPQPKQPSDLAPLVQRLRGNQADMDALLQMLGEDHLVIGFSLGDHPDWYVETLTGWYYCIVPPLGEVPAEWRMGDQQFDHAAFESATGLDIERLRRYQQAMARVGARTAIGAGNPVLIEDDVERPLGRIEMPLDYEQAPSGRIRGVASKITLFKTDVAPAPLVSTDEEASAITPETDSGGQRVLYHIALGNMWYLRYIHRIDFLSE